ncbi:hypothetical protein AV656_14720 [Bhargavaea cecembensis]|uniref:Protein kinase n=1 Tax=Bhargavaea cecembensis TaxID=394098 RepID=A0A161SHE7_9BACL|nr:hypothetical protein [Bhargavaea cecembensis]KZE36393.1 hypothetical protein AV656_14720 [Bhargavaea cecembensis]
MKEREEFAEYLIRDWRTYCTEENFLGIGSSRKVYKAGEWVIKVHLHPIGHLQSLNEMVICNAMKAKGLGSMFAEVHYVDERIAIQRYCAPIKRMNNQSFEIDMKEHASLLPDHYEEALRTLDREFEGFDLKDSDNYGLNKRRKLVFIDYGMTRSLYEKEWVPLAESGVLPQIDFDVCDRCGEKKELRMYGKADQDKRCYSCGKE